MSRNTADRLIDIAVACDRIAEYAAHAAASDDIVFDAIRMRLVEIGEAAKELDDETRRLAPADPVGRSAVAAGGFWWVWESQPSLR